MKNIAYQKNVRSNLNKLSAKYVVDGNKDTYWTGDFYPSYVDIDLENEYLLEKVVVCVPRDKKILFSLYGSVDAKNYQRIYQVRELKSSNDGEYSVDFAQKPICRILRVYIEYTENDDLAYLSDVKVYGTKANDSILNRNCRFEEILPIKPFDQSEFAREITNEETIENIYGIIDRTIGRQYRNWFSFELTGESAELDSFELSDQNGKIHIRGNIGLSLTMGLNYYYKHYLHVNVSEQTIQANLPDRIVPVGKPVKKQNNSKIRYAFNYCTLCYTFAFFGEKDWQKENDWLALNGVNLVMDLAGQEATWVKFLMDHGYCFDDAKDWLTGPAYYAWQFMDNMESFGGPVHDDYIIDRVELARTSQRFRKSLGMQTILQGYAGMVPTNFNEFNPEIKTITQGIWNGFARPIMVATNTDDYANLAESFYAAQRFVYGDSSKYFAVDPFHEGGIRPADLDDSKIAEYVLKSMLKYKKDAVWVIQGWQSNPTNALLKGMGEHKRSHALIIDLIKYPITPNTKYNRTQYGNTALDSPEFCQTDWVWGLLGGFGGNPTMNGQLQVMTDDILNARKSSNYMCGIGIISEGQFDNPIKYDLIFDLCFADESFELRNWIHAYLHRRYGTVSHNAEQAWQIMKDTNYNYGVRYTNEVYGAKNMTPAGYRSQSIAYGAHNLEKAFHILLKDFDVLKNSAGYRYDLSEIMRQTVSNYSVLIYNDILSAAEENDKERFIILKQKFLLSLKILNDVASTQKEQLAGEWIGKACDLAKNYDDFTRDAFALNAKTLITTWGSRASCRLLKDYGWRNYEGMFLHIYATAWKEYLDEVEQAIVTGKKANEKNIDDYFDMYWQWVLCSQDYLRTPKDSPKEIWEIAQRVLNNCMPGENENAVTAGDIALGRKVTIQNGAYTGVPSCITSNNNECLRLSGHTEVILDLLAEFEMSHIFVTLTDAANLSVYSGIDANQWEPVLLNAALGASMTCVDAQSKTARFIKIISGSEPLELKQVQALGSRMLPDIGQLARLLATAQQMGCHEAMLQEAVDAISSHAAPDEINTVYWHLYDALCILGS